LFLLFLWILTNNFNIFCQKVDFIMVDRYTSLNIRQLTIIMYNGYNSDEDYQNGSNTYENQVASLIEEAELKLKTKGIVDKLFGSPNYKDAARLYTKAGNICSETKSYYDAADCFEKSGNCHIAIPDVRNAVEDYRVAAACYIKVNTTRSLGKALELFKKIAEECDKLEKYLNAGNSMVDVARIYNEFNDRSNLVDSYKTAINYYEKGSNGNSSSKKKLIDCKIDYAHLLFGTDKFKEAAEIMEEVSKEINPSSISSDNPYRFRVGKYLYKAGLYRLCMGNIIEFEKYQVIYPIFNTSRHGLFLTDLIDACSKHNVDKFQQLVKDADDTKEFEVWEVEILLKIRDRVEKEVCL
jgi:alpha-soluble NSF attachment protein